MGNKIGNEKEIKQLEALVEDYDFLLQEGVVYSQEEVDKIKHLIRSLSGIIEELTIK